MIYIYILQLTDEKYYIGKTNYSNFCLDTHFTSNESIWTHKYKPIKLLELFENYNEYDEDKYTIMYMYKYGIDNVRGGSFTRIKLSESTIEHLSLMHNGKHNQKYIVDKINVLTYFDDIMNDKYDSIIINDNDITLESKSNEEYKCFGFSFVYHYKNNYLLNSIIYTTNYFINMYNYKNM